MDKYICENSIIYELNELEIYDPVVFLDCCEVKGNYANTRLNYLIENKLEFLVQLNNKGIFDKYFEDYQKNMYTQENNIVSKMPKQDAMSKLMVRELLKY